MVGQLAVMAFSVTDTMVAGRYSEQALAVLSVGTAIYVSVYVSLNGVLQALLPIYAQLHGAKDYPQLGRTVRQSLYLAALLIALGMCVMLFPGPLLQLAQVPASMAPHIENYLFILAWALPPAMLFRMYSSLNQALGKPLLVTWLQIGSLAVKIPLTIWLTFGGWGVPAMGLAGCAWASFIVNWLMLACALTMLRTQHIYVPLQLFQSIERPDRQMLGRIARMGIPGGLAYLVEITSLTLMALFIARLGVVPSASHQIAANLVGIMYMLPLALSIALSARISYWIGAGQALQARNTARMGLGMGMALASVVALSVYAFAINIAGLYSTNTAVVTLAAALLTWVAIFHWFDALQTICAFALRCYGVTLIPLLIYGVMLWGVGLAGGYALAYSNGFWGPAMQHPQAFWIAGAAALAVVALLFLALFRKYTRLKPHAVIST